MTLFEKKNGYLFHLFMIKVNVRACMTLSMRCFLLNCPRRKIANIYMQNKRTAGTQRCLLLLVRRQESFRLSYMQQPSLQHTKGISIKLLQIRVQCTLKLFYAHEVKSILTDVISPSILSTIDSLFTRGIHIRVKVNMQQMKGAYRFMKFKI